jgi:hypothetical protein
MTLTFPKGMSMMYICFSLQYADEFVAGVGDRYATVMSFIVCQA